MRLLLILYRHGLWLSWPLFVAGLALLVGSTLLVIGLGERNRLCVLPLTATQTVEFRQPGRVVLWTEGPLLTARFARLSFELVGNDGVELKGRRSWFPLRSSSFSRVRSVERLFTIPRPGRYVLNTTGLGSVRPSDENHQVVFMRPYLWQTIGCILGILFGAGLSVGSLVNFLLRLRKRR